MDGRARPSRSRMPRGAGAQPGGDARCGSRWPSCATTAAPAAFAAGSQASLPSGETSTASPTSGPRRRAGRDRRAGAGDRARRDHRRRTTSTSVRSPASRARRHAAAAGRSDRAPGGARARRPAGRRAPATSRRPGWSRRGEPASMVLQPRRPGDRSAPATRWTRAGTASRSGCSNAASGEVRRADRGRRRAGSRSDGVARP